MTTSYMGAFAALALGCSSAPDSGPTVADRCRTTVEALCARNATCAIETGDIDESRRAEYLANCRAGATTAIDCSRRTRIAGTPDVCDRDMSAMPCSFYVPPSGLPLPASCKGLYE